MARADIAWYRRDAEGEKVQVYAHQVGTRWDFFYRARRHDDWLELKDPPLEDWLEVLDGVRRRSARRRYGPEEVGKLEVLIKQRFSQVKF